MSAPPRTLNAALAALVAVLGLGGLVLGAWAASQYRSATFRRPFFVEPSGLAASVDGTLYVGVRGAEIHHYAPDGAPIGGWRLPEPGGAIRLRFGRSGALHVATRAGRRLEYDPQGVLLSDRADAGAWARFPADDTARGPSPRGGEARYALEEAGLVRLAPPPRSVLVPTPPCPLSLLGTRPVLPVSALLSLAPVALVVGLVIVRRRR